MPTININKTFQRPYKYIITDSEEIQKPIVYETITQPTNIESEAIEELEHYMDNFRRENSVWYPANCGFDDMAPERIRPIANGCDIYEINGIRFHVRFTDPITKKCNSTLAGKYDINPAEDTQRTILNNCSEEIVIVTKRCLNHNGTIDIGKAVSDINMTLMPKFGRNVVTFATDEKKNILYTTDIAQEIKHIIHMRTSGMMLNEKLNVSPENSKEKAAKQTLHKMIGNKAYRRFLNRGFVSAKGSSGMNYTIKPGHGSVKVYQDGQITHTMCLYLDEAYTPTDQIITQYLMVLANEESIWKAANVTKRIVRESGVIVEDLPDDYVKNLTDRSLTEIYGSLRDALVA